MHLLERQKRDGAHDEHGDDAEHLFRESRCSAVSASIAQSYLNKIPRYDIGAEVSHPIRMKNSAFFASQIRHYHGKVVVRFGQLQQR